MLELSKIGFSVETGELVTAVSKVQELSKAVEGLAASVGKMDQKTAKANETQAKANLINAKADTIAAKEIENLNKAEIAEIKLNKLKGQTAAATESSINATKANVTILQRQQDILEFQAQGFSKGQSSILASAKAAGILTSEMKELQTVLEDQRKLMAAQPFDKSQGALKSLRNEYQLLQDVQQQYNNESALTRKQMQELAQDRLRLTLAMKQAGVTDADQIVKLNSLEKEYTELATVINKTIAAENAVDKATKDAASANQYLERELQKVRFALDANNSELNRSTSNSLVKFENALKQSGMTLDQQKVKLNEYRNAQIALQKTQATKNTDYITRAVGPQITDIAVGLATGQAPLTIMLQQGGQLRDQFALAGVAAADMGVVMRTAMSSMASSVYDTGKAIGTMLVGGMVDMGKAVMKTALDVTLLSSVLENARYQLTLFAMTGDTIGKGLLDSFNMLSKVITGVFVTGVIGSIVVLITLGVELVKLVKQENELSNSILLTGASLGMSKDQAVQYAEGLRDIGLTAEQARTTLTEFAKAGINGGDATTGLIKAAVDLEKYTGQSIEKTVQEYKKLQEDPVKALTDLAIGTGTVTTATIDHIDALVKSGQQSQAVAEAQDIMAASLQNVANESKDSLNPITVLWIDIKTQINNVKDAIVELGTSSSFVDALSTAFKVLAATVATTWFLAKSLVQTLAAAAAVTITTATEGPSAGLAVAKEWFASMKAGVAENDKYVNGLFAANEAVKTGVTLSAEQKKLNSEAAKANAVINSMEDKYNDKQTKREDESAKALENYSKKIIAAGTDEKEINRLIEQRDKLLDNIANKLKDKKEPKVPKSQDQKDAEALAKYYDKALERVKDLGIAVQGLEDNSTKADKVLKDLQDDASFKKLTPELQDYLKVQLELISQQERANKETEKQKKLQEEISAIQRDASEFISKEKLNSTKLTNSYELRLSLLGKTEEQQKALKDQAELEQKVIESTLKFDQQRFALREKFEKLLQNKDLSGPDAIKIMNEQSQLESDLDVARGEELKLIHRGVAVSAREAYDTEMRKVAKPLTDAITTALFEGGQAGSKSLRDSVVAAFRNKISVWIEANIMGMLTGNGGGSTGGITGLIGQGSNLLSGAGTALGMFGSSAAYGAALGTTSIGAGSQAAMLAAQTGEFGAAGLAATADAMGTAMGTATSSLSSFAAAAGPWIAGAVAISALADAMKYTIDDKGGAFVAQATSSGTSSVANRRDFQQNGGLFGGGTTQNSSWADADASIKKYFDTVIQNGTTSVKAFAKALGLAPEAVDGFSKQIEVSITGLNPEQQKQAIDKAINDFLNSMVSSVYGADISGLSKEGETASGTLLRLNSNLQLVNSSLDQLGFAMFDVSIQGAAAATGLVEAFGGVEKAQSALSYYYENFYSVSEKAENATAKLASQFAALIDPVTGLSLKVPESKEAFRALVESIGVTTESGRSLVAAILGLAPAFDAAAQSAASAANQMQSVIDSRNAAGTNNIWGEASTGSVSHAAEKVNVDTGPGPWQGYEVWQQRLDFKASIDKLTNSMKTLRETLIDSAGAGNQLNHIQSKFDADLIKAQGGDLAAFEELQTLIKPLIDAQKAVSTSSTEEALFVATILERLRRLNEELKTKYYAGEITVTTPPKSMLSTVVTQQMNTAVLPKSTEVIQAGNDDMVSELRQLRTEVSALRVSADKTAANTKKSATALEDAGTGTRPFTTVVD